MDIITEDKVADWAIRNGSLMITRKYVNTNSYNFTVNKTHMVCLTGYDNILHTFFTKILPMINGKVVIILIETDRFNMKTEYINNKKVKKYFCWNKPYEHSKMVCIPIGLNHDRNHDSILSWICDNKDYKRFMSRKLLCINHSNSTNSIRGKLVEYSKKHWNNFCDIIPFTPPVMTYQRPSVVDGRINITVTNPKCYDCMKQYKYILSPAGAGLDCHRTWEALYTGCIPIVKSSAIDEIYQDLPVLVVKEWSDINEKLLEEQYEILCMRSFNHAKLTTVYWLNLIKTCVHE